MNLQNFDLSALTSLIRTSLENHRPKMVIGNRPDASVLVPLVPGDSQELCLLLTTRAKHMNSHAGEVAFPGGKWDLEDSSLLHTSLRESNEELGIEPEVVNVLGQLDQITAKSGIRVSAFVGIILEPFSLKINPDEIEQTFLVPLQFFIDTDPEFREVKFQDKCWSIPHYHFNEHHIWGMTAMIIINLLNVVFNRKIPYLAPIRG